MSRSSVACPSARRRACSPCRRWPPGRGCRAMPCVTPPSCAASADRAGPSRSSCGCRPGGVRGGGTSSRPGRRSPPPSGSTSVSSHWKRPPPSKSMTAATTGGLKRVRQAVDGVRGDRGRHVGHAHRRHLVDGAALHAHPAGGRWTKPPSCPVPTKPYFHAVARRARAGRRALGLGPPRRLAAQEAPPGEERRRRSGRRGADSICCARR